MTRHEFSDRPRSEPRRFAAFWLWMVLLVPGWAAIGTASEPLQRFEFVDRRQQEQSVEGRVVVEAVDGGLVVLDRLGRLWTITPDRLRGREETGEEFAAFDQDELAAELRRELGPDFEIVATRHYIIATRAGTKYAEWCGGLFERLMDAFLTHWRGKPLDLHEPAHPLVAVILPDAEQFAAFAARDVGPQAAAAKGYYSIASNRMVLYDLTSDLGGKTPASPAEIGERLATSAFNVATVIHEATHQIAFNCGLHTRYADNPLWLTEGMAMYFETPDLRSRSGWRTIGQVNRMRLAQFRNYAAKRRKPGALADLLSSDRLLADAEQAADAYAESWALTYFLIKTKRRTYENYLRQVAGKRPLVFNTAEERLAEFRAAFGADLERFEREFLAYVARLR